ncbi:family 16 glycosylhydrolase [uncultured Psychroserpens sp.]|uniref:family 16 glycosylhydrolase n=1 Tax=uncultured Psychroserpens sp. TaxID=255436 RepID=UPI00260D47F7|nr:family 16 glycosylhydrolase [uncultured Psychroserpens sp.]
MKFYYLICCSLLCMSQLAFSQQLPLDFSDSNDNFIAFGNSGYAFSVNPQDGNDAVGQFFNDGSELSQGFYLDLVQPINLDTNQSITLSFYSFDPNQHNILLKLENGMQPDVQVKEIFGVPSPSNWITVTFDFSNAQYSSDGTAVNATGSYNRLTLFIDEGTLTPGTYLIDDIDDGTEPGDPNALDVIYEDLVWADEFDIDGAIDASKWFHQTQLPAGGSWFNGEEQHYTNRIENSFVSNGFLNIVAIKENFSDQGETKAYTSARLNSKFAFTYGRIDVRAKLPLGDGTWPAIWTLGKNINEDGAYWDNQYGNVTWPACGEIDIMEHGLGAVNHVSSALHTPCAGCFGNTMNTNSMAISDVANNFHLYSVNWSPNQITFLIDNVAYYTYNPAIKDDTTWPFYEDQYMLLNIAMGGIAGSIDPNFTQSSMVIDYVRVYQNNLSVSDALAQEFVVSPNPASDYINITSNTKIDAVEMYDALGKLIFKKKGDIKQCPISHVESGVYILKIYAGKRMTSKKIIVN